jgi:hypothetical protein
MKSFFSLLCLLAISSVSLTQDKQEFKPTFKVWGYAFFDYFYKVASDTGVSFGQGEYSKVPKDYQAFSFRRIYLGLDAQIAENFSGQILLEGSDGTPITKGDRGVFIKAAYLEWKNLIPRASIFIGQSPTPTWPLLTEKVWAYRSVEKTITDFRGLGGSNDLGILISGKFDKKENFGYNFMFGNGKGSKPEDNKLKKYYGSLWGTVLDKRVIAEAYADYEDYTDIKSKITLKGFLAYQHEKFTVGVEALQQIQKKFYAADSTDIVPWGISSYVHATLLKDKLRAFARFDYYDPDTKYDTSRTYSDANNYYKQNFITLGLDYTPIKNVHVMPNVWINTYSDKRTTKIERKADVVGRVTFFYIYK